MARISFSVFYHALLKLYSLIELNANDVKFISVYKKSYTFKKMYANDSANYNYIC